MLKIADTASSRKPGWCSLRSHAKGIGHRAWGMGSLLVQLAAESGEICSLTLAGIGHGAWGMGSLLAQLAA